MQTVVVGGGISGLSCAYRLRQLGVPVVLLEQSERVGGVIESVEKDGFLFELGPQSFLSNEPLVELIGSLGLEAELLQADPQARRYILVGERLHCVPMSPPALLASSLLSAGTKLRLLTEPLRSSQPPESDESVADFVSRKFGTELLELLVGPFVSGVYAGDPQKLSLRSAFPSAYQWEKEYGSVIRGAVKSRPPKGKPRPALCSFRRGVATLARTLGEKLGELVYTGVGVESVRPGKADGRPRFDLHISSRGRTETLAADAVVIATHAEAARRILAEVSENFRRRLAGIEYAPVAVVGSGYRREQVGRPTDGFGFLVPRREKLRTLGTVWNSSLFPERAPNGMVNLTSFAGGATDPKLMELPDGEIVETVEKEVAAVLKINGPAVTHFVRRHTRALPQYNLGHGKTIAFLREELARFPGLFLTGNYFEGPSIGACVEQAFRIALGVQAYLSSV